MRRSVFTVLSAVVVGCADTSPPTPANLTETIDYGMTKGAAIAISEAARVSSTTLDLTPTDRLQAMVITRDGGIAMLQRGQQSVTFFGPTGELLGAFGRSGGAPGEFRGLFAIGLIGDTLWAGDSRQDNATLIGPDRQLVRTFRLPSVQGQDDFGPDLSMKVLLGLERDAFVGILPANEQLFRADFEGRMLNPLPRNTTDRNYWVRIGNGQVSVNLFQAGRKLDVSADGQLIAIADPMMEGENPPAVAVNIIRSTGDTAYVRIIEFEGVKIPQSAVDSAIARHTRGRPPEHVAAYRQQAYVPPFYPPVEDVLIGQDNRIWLKLHSSGGAQQDYLVLDSGGDLIGTVVFPSRTNVRAAKDDIVWVLQYNEFDVADVVKYAIADLPAGK